MNIKRFIDRPILSIVISVVIMFAGLIGLVMLPVEQYPEIAPPTISVSASYTGANAETMQRSVIVPLEEAINGVENMLYMTSTSTSSGTASITVYFRQGTDPDMATVNVQNRVATAEGLLPAEVTKAGVTVTKRQSSNLKITCLYSPNNTYDTDFIANYLKINVEPRLARVSGVGEVTVWGSDYALRIWLDPQKMAQYNLMPSDITAVLSEQNIEYPTGTVGQNSDQTFQFDLRYKGRLEEEVEFENLVVKSLSNGEVLYLKDVATIELGAKDYNILNKVNGKNGRTLLVSQTSGSNASEVIDGINAEIEEIKKDLPKDLEFVDLMNTSDFLDASINNVVHTLFEAIFLVILVVYIFLQSFRSTIIPAASIVVSLVGTFAVLYAIGFSLNLLTLFALVLVIGTVVDDAIVVVEAVQSKFDAGYKSPYLATIDAMKDITSALVTTSIVFMAVFIPVSFTSGTTGTFYTQFGITMAVAVAISTINALTLSPALCALIMTPHSEVAEGEKLSFSSRFHIAFDTAFNNIVSKYKNQVFFFLKRKELAFLFVLIGAGGLYWLASNTKTALIPNEDLGVLFVNIQTPPGYSLNETDKTIEEVMGIIAGIDEVRAYSKVSGTSMIASTGATNGMFIVELKNWDLRPEKSQSVDAVISKLYGLTANINNATIMIFAPPMITGYGANSGFEMHIQDRKGGSIEDLSKYTGEFIMTLNQRPEVAYAQTTFSLKFPQYSVEVDAEQCKRNGVAATDVLSTLSGYVGGNYASNFNRFSKLYRVMIQGSIDSRVDLESLENMYVRNSAGEMTPVSQYLKIEKVYGAQSLTRFNLFPSIAINGSPADGYSSGQAIQAISEVADQVLPSGYGYEFGGMTREEASTGSTTVIIFGICFIFVYLILCALYESVFIPFAVILSVPFGLAGSFLFANIMGLANDIYMQTGLIMLIGLLAKTAILLTEYASESRRRGQSVTQAALIAAKVRLRPILMTSMTMIFGMIPMALATGAGANGNISLGIGVIGGMLVGTIALIFIVPALFVIFQNIEERVMPTRVLPQVEE